MSTPPYLDLPPGVTARTVATARIPLAVLDGGDAAPDDAPVALLVPGWTGSKEDFIAILSPLAAAGVRPVAVDLRGQYESPPAPDGAYDVEELAADVVSLVDALGAGPAHLVGHSLGGLVASAAAIAKPDAWRSVTLLCSGPGALPAERHEMLQIMAEIIEAHGLAATWDARRAYEEATGVVPPPVPAEIEEFLHRRFLANDPAGLRALTLHLVREPDRVDQLARLDLPVLVAYGAADDGWPLAVQDAMAERMGTRAHVIEGGAHSPAVEAPEATVAALTAFWNGTVTTVAEGRP